MSRIAGSTTEGFEPSWGALKERQQLECHPGKTETRSGDGLPVKNDISSFG
jgi:hypothetical protein